MGKWYESIFPISIYTTTTSIHCFQLFYPTILLTFSLLPFPFSPAFLLSYLLCGPTSIIVWRSATLLPSCVVSKNIILRNKGEKSVFGEILLVGTSVRMLAPSEVHYSVLLLPAIRSALRLFVCYTTAGSRHF